MSISVRVWSDYVCPWCYVGLVEAGKLREKHDVTFDWQPFMLRPDAPEDGWDLPPHIRAMKNHPRNPLKARAEQLGIVLVERDRIPSSRRAHECTEFARAAGKLVPFHAGVLKAYWTEGKDIHAWDVLAEIATAVGLDAAAMQASVESGAQKTAVEERVAAAHEAGIHAVPTFVFGEKFMVQGAQTLDVFEKVLQQL